MATLVCHSCGTPITYAEPVPRDGECEKCQADLRACRNCRHWNPRLNNQCNETEADSISDKTRRNFCEFFYFSREPFTGSPGGVDAQKSREAEARRRLEELFRKPAKPGTAEPDED
jgi:hypothetical protein